MLGFIALAYAATDRAKDRFTRAVSGRLFVQWRTREPDARAAPWRSHPIPAQVDDDGQPQAHQQ